MPKFSAVSFYTTRSEQVQLVSPPEMLQWETGPIVQDFRKSLLERQQGFSATVEIPPTPQLGFEWVGITQTSGIIAWKRRNLVGAASLLLAGLETDAETEEIRAAMAARNAPLPLLAWRVIQREARPLLATVHYDIHSVGDCVLGTIAPAIAAAFFAMFGATSD